MADELVFKLLPASVPVYQIREVTLDSILGVPCLGCVDMERCGSRHGPSPETCMKLTGWIEQPAEETEPSMVEIAGWFACPVCGKEIPSERGWKIHVARKHKDHKI